MDEIIQYIVDFLAGSYSVFVAYGEEREESKVIILKDTKLYEAYGVMESMPEMPLKELDGIPVLYGENRVEYRHGRAYIYADLVASSYFLLSGYEEMVNKKRDKWNRFRGEFSYAWKNGFLDRPVIDEYRILLENILRNVGVEIPERRKELQKVYLTHDLDHPWKQYTFMQMIKAVGADIIKRHDFSVLPLKNWFGFYQQDSFLEAIKYLQIEDTRLLECFGERCECIYFVLANEHKQTLTETYINDKKMRSLSKLFDGNRFIVGIHGSPEASESICVLKREKEKLENVLGKKVTKIRNHCLLSRKYSEEKLMDIGLLEEFGGGYADVAGFRYGTSRTFRYIDPEKIKLTDLLIHPMIIMDGTLDEARYMGLSYEQALGYVHNLINRIKDVNGELVILWHNHMCVADGSTYHRKLYRDVLEHIGECM